MADAWGALVPGALAAAERPRRPLWQRLAGVGRAVQSVARPLTARSELLRRGSVVQSVLVFESPENGGGGDGAAQEEEEEGAARVRQDAWGRGDRARGLGALAATLALVAALATTAAWLYDASELRLLPLHLVLGGLGAVLAAGLLAAVAVFRLAVAGRATAKGAAAHQPAVFAVLLLCGFGLAVGESAFADAGYLHAQLWLLPLVGCHSQMLRARWAAAATWLPLLAYAAATLPAALRDDGAPEYFAATAGLLGSALASPAAGAAGWLSLVLLVSAALCLSVLRSERSERDAWDHCAHVTDEEGMASVEEERLEIALGVMMPPGLIGRVKARGARRSGSGGVATPLLHYHPHATIIVARVTGWDEFVRPRAGGSSSAYVSTHAIPTTTCLPGMPLRDGFRLQVAEGLNGLFAAFDSVLKRQAGSAAGGGWEGIRCDKVQATGG